MFGIPTATLIQVGYGIIGLVTKGSKQKAESRREFIKWLQYTNNEETLDSVKLRNEMLRLEKELEDK